MAVRKGYSGPVQNLMSTKNYNDFASMFMRYWEKGQGESVMSELPDQWKSWAVIFKDKINSQAAANKSAQLAYGDKAKAAAVINRNQLSNQLATIKKNLLAAQDSQTLYNKATNKQGLKDYTSTISSLKTEMARIQAALAKPK